MSEDEEYVTTFKKESGIYARRAELETLVVGLGSHVGGCFLFAWPEAPNGHISNI
jgi:hypothetical protein